MQPHIWIWVWVMLAGILCVAEVFTRGFFVLPFGIGAAAAAAIEFAWPGSVNAQWATFIGVSGVIMVVVRRTILRRQAREARNERVSAS